MKDLTIYKESELSNIIFNDNYFYNEINNLDFLKALINEEFYYTNEQLKIALSDVEEYLSEA